jgi:hypothetical protein
MTEIEQYLNALRQAIPMDYKAPNVKSLPKPK